MSTRAVVGSVLLLFAAGSVAFDLVSDSTMGALAVVTTVLAASAGSFLLARALGPKNASSVAAGR